MLSSLCIAGSSRSRSLQLQGEALGEAAGKDAGRIELLQTDERRLDLGGRAAKALGDRRQIAAEIAGLVELLDERAVRSVAPWDRRGRR